MTIIQRNSQLSNGVILYTLQRTNDGDQYLHNLIGNSEDWDISATITGMLSNSPILTQAKTSVEQRQNTDGPSFNDTGSIIGSTGILETDMIAFEHSLSDDPLDFHSFHFPDIGQENWDIGLPLNLQIQEQANLVSDNWPNETPSRIHSLSQRLFPLSSRAVFPLDSEIVSAS